MRNLVYNAVGRGCVLFAAIMDGAAQVVCWLAIASFGFVKVQVAHISMFLLRVIDGKRVESEKAATEQERQMAELNLMQAAIRVKEDSAKFGDWTDDHSHALNTIGISLIQECGWEPEQVHNYFKPLVEAIDGLEYGA